MFWFGRIEKILRGLLDALQRIARFEATRADAEGMRRVAERDAKRFWSVALYVLADVGVSSKGEMHGMAEFEVWGETVMVPEGTWERQEVRIVLPRPARLSRLVANENCRIADVRIGQRIVVDNVRHQSIELAGPVLSPAEPVFVHLVSVVPMTQD